MYAWAKNQFRDDQHIRVTLAKATSIAAIVGFALVFTGYLAAH